MRCYAARFHRLFGTGAGWLQLSLDEQVTLPSDLRTVARWCLCTGRIGGPQVADYLVVGGASVGILARHQHADFHQRFTAMAATIGNSGKRAAGRDWEARQWLALTRLAIVAHMPVDEISNTQLEAAREVLWRTMTDAGKMHMASMLGTSLFEIQATLYHLGQVDEFPRRQNLAARCDFQRRWNACAPGWRQHSPPTWSNAR